MISILVVDSAANNLSLARDLFEPLGYQIMTASSTDRALELARRNPPDLILSDINLPGRSGYELIRVVKSDPSLKPVPFIFLTSTRWYWDDQKRGLSLGADYYFRRPIEPRELLGAIEACVQKSGRQTKPGRHLDC